MEYDNRNSFVAYPNKKKASPKAPDYTGTYTDNNNKQWECAIWERTSQKDGATFFSGKISEKKAFTSKPKTTSSNDEDVDF
jgi:hypothetical protein